MKFHVFILFLTLLTLFGCGSTENRGELKIPVLRGEPVIPRDANRIALKVTSRVPMGWEDELTRKLRERFNMDGRLTVVPARDDSDVYYTVSILEFRRLPLSYDSIGRPARWRISVRTGAVLMEPPKRIIFSDEKVWAYLEYSEVEQPVLTREQAVDRLLDSMADRLTRKAITGWYTELMSDRELGKEK